MSRWLERDAKGVHHEKVANMKECKKLINDICCEGYSDFVASYPTIHECRTCVFFTQEDGVIDEP